MKRILFGLVLAGGIAAGDLRAADDSAGAILELQKKIEELDQQVRLLQRQRELDAEASSAAAKSAPKIVLGTGGLSVTSADTNFAFQLRGVLQIDNRTFFNDNRQQSGNDTFLLRRARPIFQGTIARDFDFLFVPEFAGSSASIVDAYLNYRYAPWLQLRAGKMKVPVGLEQLQSDPVTFFSERALPTALVPNRDIGFQLWGELNDGVVQYAAGVFNGVGDGRSTANFDFEDHREFAGRLFFHPFRKFESPALQGLGIGIAGSWGNTTSNALGLASGFNTDAQQTFFAYTNGVVADGDHWRLTPQGYYYYGPLGLLAEYVISEQRVRRGTTFARDLGNKAWQVSAGWVLTGEDATFAGVTPRKPFDPRNGQWGAIQIVGRYAELDVDDDTFPLFSNPSVSATEARAWGLGLNWFLTRNIRFNASYSRTTFKGGGGTLSTAPSTVTRQPEEVLITRLQLAF